MNRIAKAVFATVMLTGTAVAVTAPAAADFTVGFGVGPGYYGPPPYARGAVCNPYSRYYNPYACDDYEDYYGPPLYIGGYWYDRPLRSRWYGGHREFWVNDRWYRHDDWGRGRFYRHDGDWGRGRGGWGDRGGWGHGGHH